MTDTIDRSDYKPVWRPRYLWLILALALGSWALVGAVVVAILATVGFFGAWW